MLVPEPEAERQREHERDRERGERQLELLAREPQQQADVVDDEAERVDERARLELVREQRHACLVRRSHGVSARSSRCSSPSAVSASATASPPAA